MSLPQNVITHYRGVTMVLLRRWHKTNENGLDFFVTFKCQSQNTVLSCYMVLNILCVTKCVTPNRSTVREAQAMM